MYTTSDFKKGFTLEVDGSPYKIVEYLHVKPGKGAAFVRAKLRHLLTGSIHERTFRAGCNIDPLDLDSRQLKYLYLVDGNCKFEDPVTSEQFSIPKTKLDNWEFLTASKFALSFIDMSC